jgi:DNA-binding MarR family transcriptional regulator
MAEALNTCTRQILDIAPQIMQALRLEMRLHRGDDLSIPQFRALRFIHANPLACLSDLADHLGLTLPSASKLVDGLVKQVLVLRQPSGSDRRRLVLALTPEGEKMILAVIARAQEHLAARLENLSPAELEIVCRSMQLLGPIFVQHTRETSDQPVQELN